MCVRVNQAKKSANILTTQHRPLEYKWYRSSSVRDSEYNELQRLYNEVMLSEVGRDSRVNLTLFLFFFSQFGHLVCPYINKSRSHHYKKTKSTKMIGKLKIRKEKHQYQYSIVEWMFNLLWILFEIYIRIRKLVG